MHAELPFLEEPTSTRRATGAAAAPSSLAQLCSSSYPNVVVIPTSKVPSVTFADVFRRWDWRAIRRCPGRYTAARTSAPPQQVVGATLPVERHVVAAAKDPVQVIRLDGGGLISYEQADGSFVHTLGDSEGFQRKLAQLGV